MENTDNIEVDLVLTLREINQILEALSDKPFREVSPLIHKLHQQTVPQVQEKTSDKTDSTPTGE